MIEKIENTTLNKITGTSNSALTKEITPLQKGTIFNVEVLERIGKEYKILIGGKLFQSKLPVQMQKGDEFAAKISSVNPLVLALTEFDLSEPAKLKMLISLLGLEKAGLKRLIIEKVLESKKVLYKKKMRKLAEITEHYNNEIDELALSLLIHLIWREEESAQHFFDDDFKKVFDVSFRELCKQIFEQVKLLIDLRIPKPILQKINRNMIYDPDKPDELDTLKDKSKSFVEMISFINAVTGSVDLPFIEINELKKFRKLLLKYIIQKSVYASMGLFPDFTIVNYHNPYKLVYFIFLANDEVTRLISEFELKNFGEIKLNSFFVNKELKGKVIVENNEEYLAGELKVLNRVLKKDLNIDSHLFLETDSTTGQSVVQKSFKKLNVTV